MSAACECQSELRDSNEIENYEGRGSLKFPRDSQSVTNTLFTSNHYADVRVFADAVAAPELSSRTLTTIACGSIFNVQFVFRRQIADIVFLFRWKYSFSS